MNFIEIRSDGHIISSGSCQDEAFFFMKMQNPDKDIRGVLGAVSSGSHIWDFSTENVIEKPPKPYAYCEFDYVNRTWVDPRTLADIQRAANTAINKAWESSNLSGFTHQGLVFATDVSSRSDIDGINGYVALTGTFPDGWAGVWKAKDNSYLPITTVEQWVAFYTSMVRAGNENFAKAQQLKAQIAAATTKEEVEAIAW